MLNNLSIRKYFEPEKRRRIAPFVLLGGAVLIGQLLKDEVPRTQNVRYLLTPAQRRATQVDIGYASEGEAITRTSFRFPKEAPTEIRHAPSLRPGRYDVTIDLFGPALGHQRVDRSLTIPSEEPVRIRLEEP